MLHLLGRLRLPAPFEILAVLGTGAPSSLHDWSGPRQKKRLIDAVECWAMQKHLISRLHKALCHLSTKPSDNPVAGEGQD